jgi:hypothetical protein
MSDFPAAHSMDTTWFAIDADGCVGVFKSYEAGAVPSIACRSYGFYDFITEWCQLSGGILKINVDTSLFENQLPSLDSIYWWIEHAKYQSRLALTENMEGSSTSFEDIYCTQKIDDVILVLSSDRAIDYLLKNGCNILQFNSNDDSSTDLSPIIVYVIDNCSACDIERLVESGDIIGEIILDISDIDEKINILNSIGYNHGDKWENWVAGAYELSKPSEIHNQPLRITDLPQSLQEKIGTIQFRNLRFVDTPLLQPIEHMECWNWSGERWIDTNEIKHDRFPEYPNIDLHDR